MRHPKRAERVGIEDQMPDVSRKDVEKSDRGKDRAEQILLVST